MSNLTEKRKLGNLGEDISCRFLLKKGYKILDRNYLKPFGEIDVIAQIGDIMHFIEVKSVSRENLKDVSYETDTYKPEDNVHHWKLQRLANTIQAYLEEKGISHETNWQLDIITVFIDKKNLISQVKLMENIII